MPIIIWGSRGITSTVETGTFFCPHCNDEEKYTLKQVRPFFTLYFIPIFPVGGARRYVECRGCGQTFKEAVLDYEPPPSQGDRFADRVYDDLKAGTSLEICRRNLVDHGMDKADADELLAKMCGGPPRHCSCGQSFHPKVLKCRYCGADL